MADLNDGWKTKPFKKKRPSDEGGTPFNDMLKFVKNRVPDGSYLTYNGVTYRCVNGRVEFSIFPHGVEKWVSNITQSFRCLSEPVWPFEKEFEIIRELITGSLKFAKKKTKPVLKPAKKSKKSKKSRVPSANSTSPTRPTEPIPVFVVGTPTWNIDKTLPVYKRVIPPPPVPVKEAEVVEAENIEISKKITKCISTLRRKDIGRRTRDEYEIKLVMYRRWGRENHKKIRRLRRTEEYVFLKSVVDAFNMLCESFHWDLSEETLVDPDFVGEANYSLCTIEMYLEEIVSGRKFDTGFCSKEDYRVVQNTLELKKIITDFKGKYGF